MRRTLPVLGGALAGIVLLLASLPAFGANATVDITYTSGDNPYAYEPSAVSIQPGDSVTWVNPDRHGLNPAQPHPTRCHTSRSNGECPWSSFPLDPGESHTEQFPAEGTFVYVCSLHPYMEGTITVGDGDPSQPEPEPTSEQPTSEPEPSPEPPASEPEPTSEPEPPAAASPEPAPDGSPDEADASGGPEETATDGDDEVPEAPDGTDPGPDDDPTDRSSRAELETDRAAPGEGGGGGGTGTRALATVLLLGSAGAVWSVRRAG